jgi:yeast amino acid transporter
MFGLILILSTGIGYKMIFRTKLRDLKTVDLQTGRRTLNPEEIVELDEYHRLSKLRRFYTYVQLW